MTFEDDVDTDESPCEFAGRFGCEWRFSSSGFPSLVISRGEYDGNATEVVIALSAVVSENMVSINDFDKDTPL